MPSTNTPYLHRSTALTWLILSAAMAMSFPAEAVKKRNTGGNKIKFDKGSEESRQERDRRLSRECKGQVNAGACAGYTR